MGRAVSQVFEKTPEECFRLQKQDSIAPVLLVLELHPALTKGPKWPLFHARFPDAAGCGLEENRAFLQAADAASLPGQPALGVLAEFARSVWFYPAPRRLPTTRRGLGVAGLFCSSSI